MNANERRILFKLWKDRHTHDDDTRSDLEQRIIRIETGVDVVGSNTGAHLHLLGGSQTVDNEAVEWSSLFAAPLAFPTPSFPATELVVQEPGYYPIYVHLAFDSWFGGGDVWVTRTRGGATSQVWPPPGTTSLWTSPGGSSFTGLVPALEWQSGDVIQVWVDGGEEVTLLEAVVVPWLADRSGRAVASPSGEPDLVYSQLGDFVFFQTQYSLPLPSDIQAGDLLVLIINPAEPSSITGDFTLLDSDTRTAVYWKVAEGDEGSSVTVTFGSVSHIAAASLRFRLEGVDWATQPPEVVIGDSGTTSPFSFPSDVAPTQGPGSYWVIPFFSQTVFKQASYDASGVSYPELVYVYDDQGFALGSLWVGARFEAVASSVSPGSIAMSGSGTGVQASNTGILFVKGL